MAAGGSGLVTGRGEAVEDELVCELVWVRDAGESFAREAVAAELSGGVRGDVGGGDSWSMGSLGLPVAGRTSIRASVREELFSRAGGLVAGVTGEVRARG